MCTNEMFVLFFSLNAKPFQGENILNTLHKFMISKYTLYFVYSVKRNSIIDVKFSIHSSPYETQRNFMYWRKRDNLSLVVNLLPRKCSDINFPPTTVRKSYTFILCLSINHKLGQN